MNILAIESSCDETAAAVVKDGVIILGSSIASSVAMHEKYGGIVPEVAAREQLVCIIPVIREVLDAAKLTWEDIDTLAVTVGPGLIGSLLVGIETAKTIAWVKNKPIIPVNHVLAHMYANFLLSSKKNSSRVQTRDNILFPAISLVVSGGHTELFLMKSPKNLIWLGGTLDDAAGEAFDKTARLLGFGSRGGVAIQEAASQYAALPTTRYPQLAKLPRPMMHDKTLNFSFSGLKTAILREVNKLKDNQQFNNRTIKQLAYEVQEAITDVLVSKTLHAAQARQAKSILISGGVAANIRLREKFMIHDSPCPSSPLSGAGRREFTIHIPPVHLCTDNAAYIGAYAYFRGEPVDWHEITAIPDMPVEI